MRKRHAQVRRGAGAALTVLALAGSSGCILGANLHGPVAGSAAARQIEQATGWKPFDAWAHRTGLDLSFPLSGDIDLGKGPPVWIIGGLEWHLFGPMHFGLPSSLRERVEDTDEKLFRFNIGAAYLKAIEVANTPLCVLWAGAAASVCKLQIDGMSDSKAIGGCFTLGAWCGVCIEVRYRMVEFDTEYGRLDASGFEFFMGLRLPLIPAGIALGDIGF